MNTSISRYFVVFSLLCAGCSVTRDGLLIDRSDFARRFHEAGANGTFVLLDASDDRYLVHNADRVRRRFIPASTFKIFNSLVALETGVVADTMEIFAWDGVERSITQWNRDQTLATAFESSAVWVYQAIARRIGEKRMRDFLRRAAYGNQDAGGGIDRFWLSGDLRISPLEQVAFLKRLHERRLPFSDRTMNLVEGIMIEARGPNHVLRGKSGLADGDGADVGWYVGYVVRTSGGADRTYYFALEMDVERQEQIAARRTIAHAILGDLGLL